MQLPRFIAPEFENKICEPLLLGTKIKSLPRPIVFSNGCFDLLHRGHVTYLAQARGLGKSLIIATNSDESIKQQNKGDNRPIVPLGDRVSLLAALESVSLVTWFNEKTPFEIIKNVQPDILVKGGDWKPDDIVGADFVKERGGTVFSIPIMYQRSTSSLIKNIRKK